jgi:hypothetical protein
MQLPPVDWPENLAGLVHDIAVIRAGNGRGCCRLDVEVDAETITLLNHFEAHARHRQVRLRLPDGSGCLRGEMNTIIGLGSPSDPSRFAAKVRISFHDVSEDDCSDEEEK